MHENVESEGCTTHMLQATCSVMGDWTKIGPYRYVRSSTSDFICKGNKVVMYRQQRTFTVPSPAYFYSFLPMLKKVADRKSCEEKGCLRVDDTTNFMHYILAA